MQSNFGAPPSSPRGCVRCELTKRVRAGCIGKRSAESAAVHFWCNPRVFFVNKQQHPFPRAVYRRLRAATTRTSQKLLRVVRRRKRWPCPRTWPPAGVIYHAPAAKGTRQSKNTPTAPRSGCVRLCTQQHSPVACEGACASARGAFVGLINAHGRLPGQTPAHSRAKCVL